jgi:hypothetical protein
VTSVYLCVSSIALTLRTWSKFEGFIQRRFVLYLLRRYWLFKEMYCLHLQGQCFWTSVTLHCVITQNTIWSFRFTLIAYPHCCLLLSVFRNCLIIFWVLSFRVNFLVIYYWTQLWRRQFIWHLIYSIRYSVVSIDSSLLTITSHYSVVATLIYNDTKYSVFFMAL